jgi:hypothetical protein
MIAVFGPSAALSAVPDPKTAIKEREQATTIRSSTHGNSAKRLPVTPAADRATSNAHAPPIRTSTHHPAIPKTVCRTNRVSPFHGVNDNQELP